MNNEQRQKLEQVIQDVVNGNQDKAKENFSDYLTQKSRDVLADLDSQS